LVQHEIYKESAVFRYVTGEFR